MADAAAGAPRRIGQIALTVQDVERATTFYRDVLGLEFLFSAPPGLAFLRCGETRLMLAEPPPPEASPGDEHPPSIVYFDVADPGAAHRRLAGAGAEVVSEPHVVHRTETMELRIGFYRDRDGHLFGVMNESPAGGTESEAEVDPPAEATGGDAG